MMPRYNTSGCRPDKETPLTNIIIAATLKRFVNQRNFMATHNILHLSAAQMAAIERIKVHMEFVKGKNTKAHCNMIVFLEADLVSLLPGEKSRFYPAVNNTIKNLIEKSKIIVST